MFFYPLSPLVLNKNEKNNLEPSSHERIFEFNGWLKKHGAFATIRRVLGNDIEGACGQLKTKFVESKDKTVTIQKEIELICKLAKVRQDEIKLNDKGVLSRGYVINNGEIVFKFPKQDTTRYDNEVMVLKFFDSCRFRCWTRSVK